VDIISYEIESTAPVVVLKECVEGDGKLCGAIFLDEEFENFIRRTMGKYWTELSQDSIKKLMNDEWENGIKRGFDDEKRPWTVSVPPEYFSSLRMRMSRHPLERNCGNVPMFSGQLHLSREHLRPIFEKVTSQIGRLVNNQIKGVMAKKGRRPTAIILVGGFGRCRALYQLLREEHSTTGIEVLQASGARPWTAICRGAVEKALSINIAPEGSDLTVRVSSRISRLNYGITQNETFKEDVHDELDKYWDPYELVFKAGDQTVWYLRRGENIGDERPVRFSYYRLLSEPLEGNWFEIRLYQSAAKKAPTRKTKEVERLCTITCFLETPYDKLPIFTNVRGEAFRKLSYDVEMRSTGALLEFTVYGNGKKQGQKNVEVQYDCQ